MSLAIGIDIGGTKIAAGVVDVDGSVLEKLAAQTSNQEPEAAIDSIEHVVNSLRSRFDICAVGIGLAGFIDQRGETVLATPNLDFKSVPLRSQVSERLDLPVVLDNDANAMAWAEYKFGAGRQTEHLVCITVGTGIGAGIVLDGRLYKGGYGIAAEPGHMNVVRDGRPCGCGKLGCWEQYASGRALVLEAHDLAGRSKHASSELSYIAGASVTGLTGQQLTAAARSGHAVALQCFEIVGSWLGRGLATLASILDPELFVIGGGVIEAQDLLLEPAKASFTANLPNAESRPNARIVPAAFANDSGLIGAADLARERS